MVGSAGYRQVVKLAPMDQCKATSRLLRATGFQNIHVDVQSQTRVQARDAYSRSLVVACDFAERGAKVKRIAT